jgi:hypothetical protein
MDCIEPMITKWIALTIYQATTTATPATTPLISPRPLFIFESAHFPYKAFPHREKVVIPGADQIRITFDPLSHTVPNTDYLSFYVKDDLLTSSSPRHSFSGSRFQAFELNHTDRFSFSFDVDSNENNSNNIGTPLDKYYGWKFYVYATFPSTTPSSHSHSYSPPSTISSFMSAPISATHPETSVGLSEISFINDSLTFENLETFCFALIAKTSISTVLTNYLQSSDDFTRRFSGFILCNLLQYSHNCAYFLHLNHSFHYFAPFPEDQMSLISLAYCFHRIMADRYNRMELRNRSSLRNLFFEKLKEMCRIGSIECKVYLALCLADIAKESAENRYHSSLNPFLVLVLTL